MFAYCKYFAIFATLVLVWIPLVRGNDLKCYDSGPWKTLGSQKEVSCPNGFCIGAWTAQPGKDEKTGLLMCKPHAGWESQDWPEYRNKRSSISRNQETFLKTLLKTTDKISASGSINGSPIPGISLTGKGTAYIKDIMICQLIVCDRLTDGTFSEERKVRLEIDANVGSVEFQVKLDQKVQFSRENLEQRDDIKINKKTFDEITEIICIGQPQVCIEPKKSFSIPFEKAVLKELGSDKEVTLSLGKEINFRITGNLKPLVEKYPKVKKAIIENQGYSNRKALKNAIEKIIGDITLVAKANVEIDDSTRAEVNLNGNSNKILNQVIENLRTRLDHEFAYKICTEKKCLHAGECPKNLCNHPEDLLKKANSAEGIKLSIVFMALNLLFLTKL